MKFLMLFLLFISLDSFANNLEVNCISDSELYYQVIDLQVVNEPYEVNHGKCAIIEKSLNSQKCEDVTKETMKLAFESVIRYCGF